MKNQDLLESISEIISDYRLGEVPPMTPNHVARWVSQFDDDDQFPILQEMNYLLKKYYFSRSHVKSFLKKRIFSKRSDDIISISKIQFLDIQKKGYSQKDLLTLADEIATSQYCINLNRSIPKPIEYIYLDDCLFSGNTVRYDLQDWLENNTISHAKVRFIFLAHYTSGRRYVKKILDPIARERKIEFTIDSDLKFANLSWETKKYECLWPKRITNNQLVNQFVNLVENNCKDKSHDPRLFRPDLTPQKETLCSSPQSRNIIEAAFLKKGAYLLSLPEEPQPSMRPMGYEVLQSLGFGSIFITYRNISNNCPLVLWWGDPTQPSDHPFSKWYPLFPRKVNQ